jgi:hypothetical protein
MIIEKFIYLIFFYNNLYYYLLLLLCIRNIKYLERIQLVNNTYKTNKNILLSIYEFIESLFCLFINNLINIIVLVYNKITIFFNQEVNVSDNIIKRVILFIYNKINDLDNKLYNIIFNYVKDILFKKITNQIMEEMSKSTNKNNFDDILSNSMKIFDDILKKDNINKLSKNMINTKSKDIFNNIINDLKTDDICTKELQTLINNVKTNNNQILLGLKDKFN